MATVTLANGKTATIPDGLSDADAGAAISRLNAAVQNENQQRSSEIAQPGPELFPTLGAKADAFKAAIASGLSKAGSAITSTPGLGWTGPTANMAANVGANVAALPWDAPAAITNAITRTAQNYGYAQGEPDIPLLGPKIKSDLGIAPTSGTWAPRVENAATIASTAGESLLPSLFKGAVGEGLMEGGSYAGQKVAEATDPRLAPALQVAGAIAANAMPVEQGASIALTPLRAENAGKTLEAATQTQADINAANPSEPMNRPPITLGQVGTPSVKFVERALGAVPILGTGVEAARENALEGMVRGRDLAAQNVGATPTDTTPTAPGSALKFGVAQNLSDVAQRMDNIEGTIANNTQGPGGGSALIDVHPLLDALQGMKTTTDAAGNVRPNVAPAIGQAINAEIANINSARTPEDPVLHTQLVNQAGALQTQLADPRTPAQDIPALQAQLQQTAAAIDANLKVPFNVLRQMKTLQGAAVNADGTPSLNSHMGGQVLDAYRDTIQNHVNSLDPQLGSQYQDLNGRYKAASDASRAIGNQGEGTLTSLMRRGMGSPSVVAPLAKTPVWGEAAGNAIRQLGVKGNDEFVPRSFASAWNSMTPATQALYTQTHPDAARTLGNVSQLAGNYDIPPQTGGLSKSLGALEALNQVFEHIGLKGALGAWPLGYMAESMPSIRALAGRPQPYFRTFNENLPALAAVVQAQQRNQAQPGATP